MMVRFIAVGVALAASAALHLVAIGFWPAGSQDTPLAEPPPVLLGTDSALFGDPISPLSYPVSAGIAPVADADVSVAIANSVSAQAQAQRDGPP